MCFLGRVSATLSCSMEFQRFPMDTQNCPLTLSSCKFSILMRDPYSLIENIFNRASAHISSTGLPCFLSTCDVLSFPNLSWCVLSFTSVYIGVFPIKLVPKRSQRLPLTVLYQFQIYSGFMGRSRVSIRELEM